MSYLLLYMLIGVTIGSAINVTYNWNMIFGKRPEGTDKIDPQYINEVVWVMCFLIFCMCIFLWPIAVFLFLIRFVGYLLGIREKKT